MKVSITKKHSLGNYLVRWIICIDNADCTRAADIEVNPYLEAAGRQYLVTLYRADGKTLNNVAIASWREAKKLALLWVEG